MPWIKQEHDRQVVMSQDGMRLMTRKPKHRFHQLIHYGEWELTEEYRKYLKRDSK